MVNRVKLTKKEQLEKAFKFLLEKHTYLDSWDVKTLTNLLITEVTIRTNLQ